MRYKRSNKRSNKSHSGENYVTIIELHNSQGECDSLNRILVCSFEKSKNYLFSLFWMAFQTA